MQTKRKLILGFLLAGFGLLAACGNNPEDQNKKVGEGQNCDTEKKCDDSLKCFKKAAGETGGTCQKPCDPQAPNACGSKPNMCKEHELLDGNKDHMCMDHQHVSKDDKWHTQCEATDQSGHACHPLHAEDKAACVTLKGAAHATCEHTCKGGQNECPTDKAYKCQTVDSKKICVLVNQKVGSTCTKGATFTCQTSGPELVCVDNTGVITCQQKCDPNATQTGCSDTESGEKQHCVEVDSENVCQPIPVKNLGETCEPGEYACYNPAVSLACVVHGTKKTCEKVCTDNGNECDADTQLCETIGADKVCRPRPIAQEGAACTPTQPGTCYNPNIMLTCTDDGGTNKCKRNEVCNPVFKKLNDAVSGIFNDTVVNSETISKTTVPPDNNITQLVFDSGAITNVVYAQTQSAMYIDLKSGQKVFITDKEAFNVNTDWDVAFRSYEFYVNGGLFPGDLSIAKVDGSEDEFNSATRTSVETMEPEDFKIGAELNAKNNCDYQTYDFGGGFRFALSAPAVANGNSRWCGYGANFQPTATPNVYYVLKNSTGTWYAKLRIKTIEGDPADTTKTQFTIQYQVL